MARPKKPAEPPKPRFPMAVETFRDPDWELSNLAMAKPSAVNFLSYRRYRITAELIDEPKKTLERLGGVR